jgi:hypothetical protein
MLRPDISIQKNFPLFHRNIGHFPVGEVGNYFILKYGCMDTDVAENIQELGLLTPDN